jgi:hypothetical protein
MRFFASPSVHPRGEHRLRAGVTIGGGRQRHRDRRVKVVKEILKK